MRLLIEDHLLLLVSFKSTARRFLIRQLVSRETHSSSDSDCVRTGFEEVVCDR